MIRKLDNQFDNRNVQLCFNQILCSAKIIDDGQLLSKQQKSSSKSIIGDEMMIVLNHHLLMKANIVRFLDII